MSRERLKERQAAMVQYLIDDGASPSGFKEGDLSVAKRVIVKKQQWLKARRRDRLVAEASTWQKIRRRFFR